MSVETMARLAKLPNIVGVKDAAGDLARPAMTRNAIGDKFCQLSGDDITAAAFLAQGGVGCISVVANIAPGLCATMQNAWIKKDFATFDKIRDALTPLSKNLFVEPNPVPVKYALSKLGICSDEVRLPLVKASEATKKLVDEAMAYAGLKPAAAPLKAHG
jgi:4-hydroxy-tetrahydrodipicolinate synthase